MTRSPLDPEMPGKVFIGPVEIAGIAGGLAHGLRELGLNVAVVLSSSHAFRYGGEKSFWLFQVWQGLGWVRSSIPRKHLLRKLLMIGAHGLWGWLVFIYALFKFEVFVFLFGRTITNTAFELWLLRRVGRKIIFAGVGSDTRPPYIDGGLFSGPADGDFPDPDYLVRVTRRCKARLRLQERYANYWINSPAAAHFHQLPYIGWPSIGIPRNLVFPKLEGRKQGDAIRILHSPSNPLAKGTPTILQAIDRLREKGHAIEFVLIQNMPNERVLQELACCDFVIDQLYSDAPMAGFVTEAAHFAKPAVVAGYFAPLVSDFLEQVNIPPSLFVLPEEIESAIERMIVDSSFRSELGNKAHAFVRLHWDVREVAARFMRLLKDDVPVHWWRDPMKTSYLEGSGLPRERVRRLVASVIECGGVAALQLQDKPLLEHAFLEFSGCSSAGKPA